MPRDAVTFDNEAIANVLDEIGDLIELKGENVFRAVTYRQVARSIRDLREPVSLLLEQGRRAEIPKTGPSVTEAITQLVTTGESKRHAELKAAVPQGLITLLRVPGVGPATARIIHKELGITSIDELEEAILKSITSLRQRTGRSLIHHARDAAEEMIATLRERGIGPVSVAGSVRRYRETIGDIDLLVAAKDAAPIMNAFTTAPSVERVLANGDTKSSVIVSRGLQIDLRVVPPESWGAALLYFTGSKEHNVRLRGHALKKKLLLNEYGLYRVGAEARGQEIASRTEEEIYAALAMDWIPPELREDHGEIDAALAHTLPTLVTLDEMRGDLHTHTNWTDGRDTLTSMAHRARDKGYAYMSVTDHSPGLGMTNGLGTDRITARVEEARKLNEELAPFRIIVGTEVDIRANGTLDYPDDMLARFDIVSASVHSAFGQTREVMTERVLTAMRHPLVTAISHPTGRLLERRDPHALDLQALIDAAAETGTWIEINGGPERLDLPDIWVRKAVDKGVTLVANSDAHATEELEWMEYAVATARRGWAPRSSLANAGTLDEMLARRKRRA